MAGDEHVFVRAARAGTARAGRSPVTASRRRRFEGAERLPGDRPSADDIGRCAAAHGITLFELVPAPPDARGDVHGTDRTPVEYEAHANPTAPARKAARWKPPSPPRQTLLLPLRCRCHTGETPSRSSPRRHPTPGQCGRRMDQARHRSLDGDPRLGAAVMVLFGMLFSALADAGEARAREAEPTDPLTSPISPAAHLTQLILAVVGVRIRRRRVLERAGANDVRSVDRRRGALVAKAAAIGGTVVRHDRSAVHHVRRRQRGLRSDPMPSRRSVTRGCSGRSSAPGSTPPASQ